jgi:hypothetical protein
MWGLSARSTHPAGHRGLCVAAARAALDFKFLLCSYDVRLGEMMRVGKVAGGLAQEIRNAPAVRGGSDLARSENVSTHKAKVVGEIES